MCLHLLIEWPLTGDVDDFMDKVSLGDIKYSVQDSPESNLVTNNLVAASFTTPDTTFPSEIEHLDSFKLISIYDYFKEIVTAQ